MDCHIHAFRYLQGVPSEILYDNMKQVVIGRAKGRARFNIEFMHFAHHYVFHPRACPPGQPPPEYGLQPFRGATKPKLKQTCPFQI